MPKEFWIPKIDPLHQVAARTTSQPKPPSGGTNPASSPCFSTSTPASEAGDWGGRGGLHPASIGSTVLSCGTILHSLPAIWSSLLLSASWGASLCSIWGTAAGCSVRDTSLDGGAWLSNPLIPMLSGLVERLQWALCAQAWDIGHWHKSPDLNNRFDWLSVKMCKTDGTLLTDKPPTRCLEPKSELQLQRINANLQSLYLSFWSEVRLFPGISRHRLFLILTKACVSRDELLETHAVFTFDASPARCQMRIINLYKRPLCPDTVSSCHALPTLYATVARRRDHLFYLVSFHGVNV